jgi:hypothetical protein
MKITIGKWHLTDFCRPHNNETKTRLQGVNIFMRARMLEQTEFLMKKEKNMSMSWRMKTMKEIL